MTDIKRKKPQKSDVKKELLKRYPSVCSEGADKEREAFAKSSVCIEEYAMRVYHIRNEGLVELPDGTTKDLSEMTVEDLMTNLTYTANFVLKNTNVTTFVVLMEKYRYVPQIKSIERNERQKRYDNVVPYSWDGTSNILLPNTTAVESRRSKEEEGEEDEGEEYGGEGEGEEEEEEEEKEPTTFYSGCNSVPAWTSLLANKKAKHRMMDEVLELLELHPSYIDVPRGKRVLIDGGKDDVPLLLYRSRDHALRTKRVNSFFNQIGESEIRAFLYAEWFSRPLSDEQLEDLLDSLPNYATRVNRGEERSAEENEELKKQLVGDSVLLTTDTDAVLFGMYYASRRMCLEEDAEEKRDNPEALALSFHANVHMMTGALRCVQREELSNVSDEEEEVVEGEEAATVSRAGANGNKLSSMMAARVENGEEEEVEERDLMIEDPMELKLAIAAKRPRRFAQVLDLNALAGCVMSDVAARSDSLPLGSLEDVENLLFTFCAVCFAFGGDYLDGFQRLTAETLIAAFLDNVDLVGSFVYTNEEGFVLLRPNGIRNLLLLATGIAYAKRFSLRQKPNNDDDNNKKEEEREEDSPSFPSSLPTKGKGVSNNGEGGGGGGGSPLFAAKAKRKSRKAKSDNKHETTSIRLSLEEATKIMVQNLKCGSDYMAPDDFSHRVMRIVWYLNYVQSRSDKRLKPEEFGYKKADDDQDEWDFC